MSDKSRFVRNSLAGAALAAEVVASPSAAVGLTNPVLFVTQVPMPKGINGNVSNTFASVVSLFGIHLVNTAYAGRGGDLWLMRTGDELVHLTRKAGFGASDSHSGAGIGVCDPSVRWSAKQAVFSREVGSFSNTAGTTLSFWQHLRCAI